MKKKDEIDRKLDKILKEAEMDEFMEILSSTVDIIVHLPDRFDIISDYAKDKAPTEMIIDEVLRIQEDLKKLTTIHESLSQRVKTKEQREGIDELGSLIEETWRVLVNLAEGSEGI